MSAVIEKTCTVTNKGQTTLPLAVRQILGVSHGGRISIRATDGRVTIEPVVEEHRDPAIGAFLRLIEADIAAARHIGSLPEGVLAALKQAGDEVDIDLDQPITGDVCL